MVLWTFVALWTAASATPVAMTMRHTFTHAVVTWLFKPPPPGKTVVHFAFNFLRTSLMFDTGERLIQVISGGLSGTCGHYTAGRIDMSWSAIQATQPPSTVNVAPL
ncbi:hypothetical protein PGT21_009777 [Puccinia graminis f. sp. tritici]|uniref:Secreted protein n=1 Tax=Puccinia graminis f. sp. tritici TaxID=56615 RepID=A0A5B0PC84_PUCGR|nr:hypothetical protein PGT21_009777 [Puccinia graminis f. sp. tritici]KAA1098646.1 hypothetical protein PGTUg99_009579 [Puccinia graminis f. sp. tritici]